MAQSDAHVPVCALTERMKTRFLVAVAVTIKWFFSLTSLHTHRYQCAVIPWDIHEGHSRAVYACAARTGAEGERLAIQ